MPISQGNQAKKKIIGNKLPKKRDRKSYSAQRYQAKKQEYHERYLKKKTEKEQQEKESNTQLYEADSIQVLMSLQEYTELNQIKQKLWLDFIWTFKDLNKTGFYDIIQIQKIEQVANNLISDYYQTAKAERRRGENWNDLTEEQQTKLIKHWGREKVQKESELKEALETKNKQGENYEKVIELAKLHEERGKIKCPCYDCEAKKEIKKQIKREILSEPKKKVECPDCGRRVKVLDEENGICKKCVKSYIV